MHQNVMKIFQGRKLELKDIFAGEDKVFVRSVSSSRYMGGLPPVFLRPQEAHRSRTSSRGRSTGSRTGRSWSTGGMNDAYSIAMQAGALKMPEMAGTPGGRG
jgi:hypothetical protein